MTAPLMIPSRDALAEVLKRHVWVGHLTHRAECDCNWRAPSGATITGLYEHAKHVADALSGVVRAADTLTDDEELVGAVSRGISGALWEAGHDVTLRTPEVANAALRALAAALDAR